MVFWCLCHPVSIDVPTQWQCWCNYPLWQIHLGYYARYKAKSGTCTRSNCSSEEIDSFGGLFKLTLYPHRFICKESKTYNDILALQTQHWSLFIQHSQLDTAASALQAAISRTWSRWGKRSAVCMEICFWVDWFLKWLVLFCSSSSLSILRVFLVHVLGAPCLFCLHKLPFLLPSSLLKPATYIWYWTKSHTGPLGTWSLKWRRSCEPIANIELEIKEMCDTAMHTAMSQNMLTSLFLLSPFSFLCAWSSPAAR